MNTTSLQHALHSMGWTKVIADGDYGPVTTAAVEEFQNGFAYWDLAVDGKAGPLTKKAVAHAIHQRDKGLGGTASEHFSFVEFACKCGGKYKTCARIKLDRKLVRGLEKLRVEMGFGFSPVSGYRCPSRNKAVGGVSNSQHLYGKACDVPAVVSRRTAKFCGFTGVGFNTSTGKVAHVDVRAGAYAEWPYGR